MLLKQTSYNQNRVILWEYHKLKPNLSIINKGDLVLSFNKKKTIIAVGYAISESKTYKLDSWQDKSKEQWVDINWIWKCKKDLSDAIKTDLILKDTKNFMYSGTVLNWTNSVDSVKLLTEIGKKNKGK